MKKQRKNAGETAGDPKPPVEPSPAARGASPAVSARSPRLPRIDLLLLALIVLVMNLPYLSGRFMPDHDTRSLLGFLDYFYSNFLFAGELPRWMTYGLYGLDASAYQIGNLTAPGFLALEVGKILGVTDSLQLLAITVLLEEWIFLLGMYLLCKRLFKERLTVFCVCLFAATTIMWQAQIFMNFRLYYLLPLTMYFILRLKQDGKGCFGWLAGIAAVLGPLGGAVYCYPFWAFLLTVFSVALFWGQFRTLLSMVRPTVPNLAAAAAFIFTAAVFAGNFSHILDNSAFVSPDRSGTGSVPLPSFLTYGGNALNDIWRSYLVPSAFVGGENPGRMGMNDYLGLVSLLCLPFAVRKLASREARAFVISAVALFALSRGGLIACLVYYFPGMHLYRHIGYLTAVTKVLVLIVAGFGLEALLPALRERTLLKNTSRGVLVVIIFAALLYFDIYVGGPIWAQVCAVFQPGASGSLLGALSDTAIYALLRAMLLAGLGFAVWQTCRSKTANANLAIYCFAACIVGDCLLFQLETRSLLHLEPQRIAFTTLKPGFVENRSDRIAPEAAPKYQAWQKSHGSDYQITFASGMQWDSLVPRLRTDWFPSNVLATLQTMDKVDTNEMKLIFAPKLRLFTQAVAAPTDDQALALLASQSGWDARVIITAPADEVPAVTAPNPMPGGIKVDDFSANSLSFSLTNSTGGPAWVVYTDAYTPNWHAEVNGKPVPLREAYAAFKAVRVEPGENRVRLYYDKGWRSRCLSALGGVAGLAAAIALTGLLVMAVKEPMAGMAPASKN